MSSPLEFAKQFEKLKSQVQRQPAADIRLLMLVDFWPELKPHKNDPAYASYLQEYFGLGLDSIKDADLPDLTVEELGAVLTSLRDMDLTVSAKSVAMQLARSCLYVNDAKGVLDALDFIAGEDAAPFADEHPDMYSDPQAMLGLMDDRFPELMQLFKSLADEVEADRNQVHSDQVHCLFVEDDPRTGSPRGRMARLRGEVTKLPGGSAHEVAFENQVKSPDDPFVGAMYDALGATRTLFMKNSGYVPGRYPYMKGRFAVDSYSHTFTGDSIGLAAALLAFAQVAKIDVQRHERFIGSDVAVTGGIHKGGLTQPVNESSLAAKLKRAFFSHVKYLLLAEDSLNEARRLLAPLEKKYYGRRLHLVGHRSLADAVADHNVVRAEKLCIGEFVAKRAYKYSRMVQIQIPLLLIVAYALVCAIEPKAWIGFDWNPHHIESRDGWFEVLNADSVMLWKKTFTCPDQLATRAVVANIDSDDENEILIMPGSPTGDLCERSPQLFAFDTDGDSVFVRDGAIIGRYCNDTSLDQAYHAATISVVGHGDSAVIISRVAASYPSRQHFKFWSGSGGLLGWYVHTGMGGGAGPTFLGESIDSLYFLNLNRRMSRVGFFVLDGRDTHGVSPPLHNCPIDSGVMQRANELVYIVLPQCRLGANADKLYTTARGITREAPGVLRVTVGVLSNDGPDLDFMINSNLRVFDVRLTDPYRKSYDSLFGAGSFDALDQAAYTAALLDSVAYATDSGWVSEQQLREAGL